MARKPLSKQMPDAWSIFFKKRKPRLLQEQAMPLLIQGKSVLLSGPTASGKTEAAVTPLLQRHISFRRKQVSVIYIAPTKALVNDIYYRLDSYLCARMPDSVRRYTGDHHGFKDPEGLFLLITTPEALDSLQLTRPESLSDVRAIVVDEIHMLHGNARGQQLRHVLNRIEKNAVKPQKPKDVFQKIGMTATLQDMENVSKIWLGSKAITVKAGDPRDIDITYLQVSVPEDSEKAAESANVIADWFEETGTTKGLIFGNTRNNTQVLAANLHENLRGSRWPVHWHTGIITASERERVEDAMKNERFGICVATATLEVGVDIGDLDIIILADPPYSINAFLQRIGRGNRESDICKVVALYTTEQELTLFHALHHCASTGTLDEIHEYDRAAVRFQQIVSFAWHGANQDKPLTQKNLSARTSDPDHGPVVKDMLETGSLENIQGALLLSRELTDQGERRQIHTTITGAATLNMVDSSSGETMISASGQNITQGALFVGGKIKNVTSNVDGTVSLESIRGKRIPFTSLPATRGKRGLGRKIIWALAEVAGKDPHLWEFEENRIITWGGADYNRLLTIILKMEGITRSAQPDEYGISGIPDDTAITPSQILEWTQLIQESENLPIKEISQFCDRSRYFSYLSPEMQETEAQRSVPFQGFIKWLQECLPITEENTTSNPEKYQEEKSDITESTIILQLQWAKEKSKNPTQIFARALVSHLSSIDGKISASTSDIQEIDDLDLDDCAVLLRDKTQITLKFSSEPKNTIFEKGWLLEIDAQTGCHARIIITTDKQWNPSQFDLPFLSLQWLQADFDLISPLGLIALAQTNTGIHPNATHTLVGLASSCGSLEKADLIQSNTTVKINIGSWFLKEPDVSDKDLLHPIFPYAQKSLWLPQQKTEPLKPELWFLFKDAIDDDKKTKIALDDIHNKLLPFCQENKIDFAAITNAVNQFLNNQASVNIIPFSEKPDAKFLTPVQDETILYIIPEQNHIFLAIVPNQKPEITCHIILHGLAHITLGHVRSGDTFSHSDTIENIIGHGYLCRWDKEAHALFGISKKESLADCTPAEKAQLGVWNMIGEMLGKSLVLHRKAEKYQKAAYQRQAAQRLLAQLMEYGGSMLCDGVGLGKTYVTTTLMVHFANAWNDQHKNDPEFLSENPFRITVLAPNSVVTTWQREAIPPLAAHSVTLSSIRVISHTKLSRITGTSSVLKPASKKKLSDLEHLLLSDLVIVDEAHNFRSISARRTLVLRDLLRLQPRKNLRRLVLLLTATPVNNSLDDLQQEAALLFSRPLMLSDAQKAVTYHSQAIKKIQKRCSKARTIKANKGDVAPLLIHGSLDAKFPVANDFRDDLDFGPNVQRIGDYLKEQDKKLKQCQNDIKAQSNSDSKQQNKQEQIRIAEDLLDRIVVQRSRALCKEIELQQNSDIDLLFRPDADKPEKLSYADEYDGIEDVLANFLPLFETNNNRAALKNDLNPLSLKVYMWYDVREGIKEADEVSSVVGLQRILVLKRLESSPVSFLITLIRLLVLHAHRLQMLLTFCGKTSSIQRQSELQASIDASLNSVNENSLIQLASLATGSVNLMTSKNKFLTMLSNAYRSTKPAAETDDKQPFQLSLFDYIDETVDSPDQKQLDNLWPLRKAILADFDTLLTAAPRLTKIIFGRFGQKEWPGRFIAGGESVDWPRSAEWGLRIITDGKIRNLISRLIKARREKQKIIVFSQFSDSLSYIYSVLKACHHFDQKQWGMVVKGLELQNVTTKEIQNLLKVTRIITGDTEDRDILVNSFAPYYRIGPKPPVDNHQSSNLMGNDFLNSDWAAGWLNALNEPVDILLSTDVLAEGVNLQDVAVLVNFDIHWNPVRMIQRAGRIDRRLNPAIEKAASFPELEALAKKNGHSVSPYYWHDKSGEAPLIINMILPDEIEKELMLRERIATKTLAIDFTLGLEQGTGAEAQWMENYKYQGISSLNAFQKDRAIERLGAYYEQLNINFKQKGIKPDWIKKLNGWFRTQESTHGSPLVGMVKMGRKGSEQQLYSRYLEPTIKNGVPHWLWSQFKPGDSLLNFWLVLDAKRWPPAISKEIELQKESSLPISADILLKIVIQLIEKKISVEELPPKTVGRPLQQGATAISAGYFGSEDDRKQMAISSFFLLQMNELIDKFLQ